MTRYAYDDAINAVRRGRVVVVIPTVDEMQTRSWPLPAQAERVAFHADPRVRAALLVSVAMIAHHHATRVT